MTLRIKMPITVHLGVIDLPYPHSENIGKTKKGKNKGRAYASTTGDVAAILEDKYGVMQFFWNSHQGEIVDSLHDNLQGYFDQLLNGSTAPPLSNSAIGSDVETQFAKFLSRKEMDRRVKGVPTAASLTGVSLRFKKKKGPVRPSFIDTGLYESSFKCWVD